MSLHADGLFFPLTAMDVVGMPAGLSRLYFRPARDQHGNALGGVRLPHVAVPTATYTGLDLNPEIAAAAPVFGALITLGGTCAPFADAKLRRLYPGHAAYVLAVALAAEEAYLRRWIIREDRDRFVIDAARSDVGR